MVHILHYILCHVRVRYGFSRHGVVYMVYYAPYVMNYIMLINIYMCVYILTVFLSLYIHTIYQQLEESRSHYEVD